MKNIIMLLCSVLITNAVFAGETFENTVNKQTEISLKTLEILKKVKTQEELKKQHDELLKLDKEMGVYKKKIVEYEKKNKEISAKLQKVTQKAIQENMRVNKLGDFNGVTGKEIDPVKYKADILFLQEEITKELQKMVDLLKKVQKSSDFKKHNEDFIKTDRKLNDLGSSLMKQVETLRFNKTKYYTINRQLLDQFKRLEAVPEMKTILINYKNLK